MDSNPLSHDSIKEAFARAKQDINQLRDNISTLHHELEEIKQALADISTTLSRQTDTSQNPPVQPLNPSQNPAHQHTPAHNLPLYGLKTLNPNISTGNKGVPAVNANFEDIHKVSQLLSSLDTIKQEVRVKFKNLTPQEMLVFSTIYQLEEENLEVTYPLLASKLTLTQSSVRDYAQRLIKKGVPISKEKVNNKKILLTISPDLKKIASLSAILQLREL